MRRIVVMSDVHGNLTALKAVVDSLPEHDEVVVAGDLCLDGPDPAGVIDLLRELDWPLAMGNTDFDIIQALDDLKPKEADTVVWTREQLGAARLRFLVDLPFSHRIETGTEQWMLAVHANPLNMDEALSPTMTPEELEPYLRGVDAEVLAFGHLHTPYVRPVGDLVLVDVSSVGHPKDRDLRSAYTVFEWDGARRSINQVRVPYDVERAVDRMRRCGMPHAEKRIASLLKASY